MDFTKHTNCIICGQNSSRFFREKDGWRLVKCPNDGLIYVDPQPTAEDLVKFYNSGKYFHSDNNGVGYKDYIGEKFFINLGHNLILRKILKCFPEPITKGELSPPQVTRYWRRLWFFR